MEIACFFQRTGLGQVHKSCCWYLCQKQWFIDSDSIPLVEQCPQKSWKNDSCLVLKFMWTCIPFLASRVPNYTQTHLIWCFHVYPVFHCQEPMFTNTLARIYCDPRTRRMKALFLFPEINNFVCLSHCKKAFSFFLSCVANTQLNHWTKWAVRPNSPWNHKLGETEINLEIINNQMSERNLYNLPRLTPSLCMLLLNRNHSTKEYHIYL